MPKYQKMMFTVIDTETDARRHVIDIGCTVIDLVGNVYQRCSFLIGDMFDRYGPYYKAKRPIYEQMLSEGKIERVRFSYARKILREIVGDFNTTPWAYNAQFDSGVLNGATKYFKMGETFFDADKEWFCLWKGVAALQDAGLLFDFPDHKEVTESGKYYKSSAESVFRHFFADGFEERHTAADDSKIEAAILACFLRRISATKLKDMIRNYSGAPYRSFTVPVKEPQEGDAERDALAKLIASNVAANTPSVTSPGGVILP